jgi:hypothetical protein
MAPKLSEYSSLGELIYAMEVSATYTELLKATDEDLREIAKHAIRAAAIFKEIAQ